MAVNGPQGITVDRFVRGLRNLIVTYNTTEHRTNIANPAGATAEEWSTLFPQQARINITTLTNANGWGLNFIAVRGTILNAGGLNGAWYQVIYDLQSANQFNSGTGPSF